MAPSENACSMLSRFLFILLALSALLWSPASLASSPAEPPFKTQLRGCFEANRPTEWLRNPQTWSQGKSMFPSYQSAVSISLSCMRSVCGSKNGLCCNTYCTMFGLTGNEHASCFNKCFDPFAGL